MKFLSCLETQRACVRPKDNLRAAEGDKWEAPMQNTLYSETHQHLPRVF